MSDSEIDFAEDVEVIGTRTKNVEAKLEKAQERILELQGKLDLLGLSVKEAEQRARSAEALAEKARESYRKAIELKDGQYEDLIRDLFKAPQKELVGHMETQSRKANARTVSVAIASILITTIAGGLLAVYSQRQNAISTNALIAKMERNLTSTNDLVSRMDRT